MTTRSAFFDALASELPDDDWGARLQEELSAHLEDAVYFAALNGTPESAAEQTALSDLGSPTLILQEFHHAMTYKTPSSFILHAIGVGLVASPIFLLATLFLRVGPFAIPPFIVLFALYVVLLAPIYRHIDGRAMDRWIPMIVSGIPLLLVVLPLIWSLASSLTIHSQDQLYLLGLTILSYVINLCIVWFATSFLLDRYKHAATSQKKGRDWSPIIRIFSIVASLFFIASTLLNDVFFVRHPSLQAFKPLLTITILRKMLDGMFVFSNAIFGEISPITSTWTLGIILSGIGIIGTYFIIAALVDRIKHRTSSFPWLWLAAMIYVVTLVGFSPTTSHVQVQMNDIPNVNISESIEKSELGPFYTMGKYLNAHSINPVFHYNLSAADHGDSLEIQQSGDHVFTISHLRSVDSYTMTSKVQDTTSFQTTNFQANIWCHSINAGEKVSLANGSPMYCSDLYVGDLKIFDAPQGIDIGGNTSSVTLSADGNWLLFSHDTDNDLHQAELSPSEVYLIDLRSMTPIVPEGWTTLKDAADGIEAIVPKTLMFDGCTQPTVLDVVDGNLSLGALSTPCQALDNPERPRIIAEHDGKPNWEIFDDVFYGISPLYVEHDIDSPLAAQMAVAKHFDGCELVITDWYANDWTIVANKAPANPWNGSACGLFQDNTTLHGFFNANTRTFVYWSQPLNAFPIDKDVYADNDVKILPLK